MFVVWRLKEKKTQVWLAWTELGTSQPQLFESINDIHNNYDNNCSTIDINYGTIDNNYDNCSTIDNNCLTIDNNCSTIDNNW